MATWPASKASGALSDRRAAVRMTLQHEGLAD
jgi:hypothetical protein